MINQVIVRLRNSAEAISRTDGKIALTALGMAALLLLLVFTFPIMKADATHCDNTALKPCTEDVRKTKHNLGANADIAVSGTTEVCIFCHTPHGGRTVIGSAPTGQAPLWNRAIKTSVSYTPYSSPNFDGVDPGASGAPGLPKGVSLACLSCHDGTISFDALVNPAGSGGFIPNNLSDTSSSGDRMNPAMTFSSGGGVDSTGTMSGNPGEAGSRTTRPTQTTGGFTGGLADFVGSTNMPNSAGGVFGATEGMAPYPNLTLDLRDDHPISIQMPGDAGQDPQFFDVFTNRISNLDGGTGDGTKVSYVSRFGVGAQSGASPAGSTIWSQDKRDRIRLYPSVSGQLSEYVECASCHNPHTPRPLFLRLPTVSTADFSTVNNFANGGFGTRLVGGIVTSNSTTGSADDLSHMPNQGSLVCLSCHQK